MFAGGAEELVRGERHGRGVEDATGNTDERKYQNELKWVDDVVAELRGGDVETKDKGYSEAKDRGASNDGIDADEEADGYAPCEFFRGGSHAEERQDGKSDAAVEPVVMDWGGNGRRDAEV